MFHRIIDREVLFDAAETFQTDVSVFATPAELKLRRSIIESRVRVSERSCEGHIVKQLDSSLHVGALAVPLPALRKVTGMV